MHRKMERRRQITMILAAVVIVLLAAVLLQFLYLTKDVELTVQSTEAAKTPGETVTVAVVIGENPGFTEAQWYLEYDRTRLELLSINDSYSGADGERVKYLPNAQVESGVQDAEGVSYGYLKASFSEIFKEENVGLCSLTFRILEDASVGVADVQIFGNQFTRVDGNGKTHSLDVIATEGGILVGEPLCKHVDEEKDTRCDLCGKQVAYVEPFHVAGSNMTLGNKLELNFLIKRSDANATTKELTAYVTHHTEEGETIWEFPEVDWERYDSYYKISVGVKASQMTDRLSLEIRDKDGYVYSYPYTTSVRDYAARTLEKTGSMDLIRTLIVDMLNYGASAQQYFKYKTEDLANAGLTEELQAMASAPVECKDSRVKGPSYVGTALSLEEQILLNLIFDGIDEENRMDMYAEISFTNALGEEKFYTVQGEDFKQYGTYGYSVAVDQIVPADACQLVTVTVKNADGSVHGSASDSVESYISRTSGENKTDVHSNIMKYAVSAYNYVSRK